jgi:hypothetical protein
MKRNLSLFTLLLVILTSCSSEPTLQKFYVEHGSSPGYMTVDIAPNFIGTEHMKLTKDQEEALKSLHKFNVLVYQTDSLDVTHKKYNVEKDKVKSLVKNEYEELMKMNDGKSGASISTKGEGEHIDEFVVFVHNEDNGFGVVRVLGDDMTPTNVLTIAGLLQESKLNMSQFKPLKDLMAKKK